MDKEEYIFLNKKYEMAITAIKAQLFDVISNEEKKAMRIGLEMSREGISEDKYKQLQELAMKQGEDLGRVITLTGKLSDTLVRLDSYTKILRDLRKEKTSTEEAEKNVQATAAEVITSINETNVSQETKDKVIENVGVIAEATQVEVPELANVQTANTQEASNTPVVNDTVAPLVPVEEAKVEATPVETAPVVAAPEAAVVAPLTTEETPVVNDTVAPLIPVEEAKVEATPVETAPVVAAPEAAVVASLTTEETPVVNDTVAPLIPVEEAKVEATPVETAPVAAAPVVAEVASATNDEVAPLIPVEEAKVDATSTDVVPPVVVETVTGNDAVSLVINDSIAPLIPVDEVKTDAAPAPVESASSVVEEAAPLIAISTENTGTAVVDAALAQESTANEVVVEQNTPSGEVETNKPIENSDTLVFTKKDKLNAKALLTTIKQISNLRKSLSTQETLYSSRTSNSGNASLEQQLVDNGLLPADIDTMKKQVEQLMEQANALYKEGKTTEAQAMYDKISEMNKQIQAKEGNSLSA